MLKKILCIFLCIIFLFLYGCDKVNDSSLSQIDERPGETVEIPDDTQGSDSSDIDLHVGDNGNWWVNDFDTGIKAVVEEEEETPSECQTHTDIVLSYLNDEYSNIAFYADGTKELSKPKAINLTCDGYASAEAYVLIISESPEYSYATVYSSMTNSFNVVNLKIHTVYYYKIRAIKDKNAYTVKTGFVV